MIRAANHLLIGVRAILMALLLSLAPLLISAQGAQAEILPIPMDVQYDVTSVASAGAEEVVAAPSDDVSPDHIIAVLKNGCDDGDERGDETVPLVVLTRFATVEPIALFSEPDGGSRWGASSRWRPPTHFPIGA